MKRLLLIAFAGLAGCAAQPTSTKSFFARENAISATCLAPMAAMTPLQRFTKEEAWGISPATKYFACYSDQVRAAANVMRYPHAGIVNSYADYLVRLGAAVDNRTVSADVALASYRQMSTLFNESIAAADAQAAAQARRDFADRLAALGTFVAEQDRQRAAAAAANRPVVCSVTGVYVQNTVVCN